MANWNHRISRMLLLWLRQISLNFDAHYKEASHLSTVDTRYITVIGTFAALSAVTNLVNIAEWDIRWLSILLQCIAAASSILVVWANNMRDRHKFEENSIRNKQAAEQYDDLSAYIQSTIIVDEKPEPAMFLRTVMDRFRFVKQFGPDLPDGFASMAGLPNLILMKDAQRRKEEAGEEGEADDLDFIKSSDANILGGETPQDSPVVELREVVVDGDLRDNIPIPTVRMENESDEDSMEIINQMGLCKAEVKPSMVPRRLNEATLMAQTDEVLNDMSGEKIVYIGPRRNVHRRKRKKKPNQGPISIMTPRPKEPPKTNKQKLDEKMDRKMKLLQMGTM
jgi:hypothetical protein